MLSTGSFNKSTGNDPISLTTNPDETSSTSSSAPTLSAEPHGTAVNHYLNYLKSSHRTAAPTPANALSPSPGQDAVNAQDSHSNPYHGPYGQHRFDRDYGRENNAPMADEAEARRIWAEKGWLPAIAGPWEEERRKMLHRFHLGPQIKSHPTVERIADLAKDMFRAPTVLVTLVLKDRMLFVTTRGWLPNERIPDVDRESVPLDSGLCPHRMVLHGDEEPQCMVLNTSEDWRFEKNPYVVDNGPIQFFASANIYLPILTTKTNESPNDKSTQKVPARLAVGSLCIIDQKKRDTRTFDETQQRALMSLAAMVGHEFELEFEKARVQIVQRQAVYLGDIFRSQMVYTHRLDKSRPANAADHHDQIARSLCELIGADSAGIIDLRGFHAPVPPVPVGPIREDSAESTSSSAAQGGSGANDEEQRNRNSRDTTSFEPASADGSSIRRPAYPRQLSSHTNRSAEWYSSSQATESGRESNGDVNAGARSGPSMGTTSAHNGGGGLGSVSVLGQNGHDWKSVIEKQNGVMPAIHHFLVAFYNNRNVEFDSSTSPSPLMDILPTGTKASIAVPVFDASGEPALLVVVCSSGPYFRYEPDDRIFVENVGAVVIGSLLRKRILAADSAKLSFVSQISHELRTPLHGIGSQLELIRAIAPKSAMKKIAPLLEIGETCCNSLREILDDTLAFSKMANQIGDESTKPPVLTEVVLEDLVDDVVKSCWSRSRQLASESENQARRGEVDIILITQLKPGQRAMVDVGGVKRVLMNLIGNSLKFCEQGSVTITLSEVKDSQMVSIEVADTGRGMSEEFMRSSLFTPFRQADSFGTGAGLGVSIADSICRRMKGSLHFSSVLGQGTNASVRLPLELRAPDKSPEVRQRYSKRPNRRVLSAELSKLFSPLSRNNSAREGKQDDTDEDADDDEDEQEDERGHVRRTVNDGGHGDWNKLKVSDVSRERAGSIDSQRTSGATSPAPPLDKEDDDKDDQRAPRGGNGTPRQGDVLLPNRKPKTGSTAVRVLIVDDNPIARRILTTFLQTKKVPFAEAKDGVEAVRVFESFEPNLVWCDVQMPVMDGIEATRKMRELERERQRTKAHIVAISGLSSDLGSHASVLESGQVDEWLTKGGPTLKTLAQGLIDWQEILDGRTAEATERAADEDNAENREGNSA